MDLIFVAYAVAPGPGGPEGHVNARLLQALAEHWQGNVTVITGGGIPCDLAGRSLAARPGWRFHCLGETGFSPTSPFWLSRIAHWARTTIQTRGRGEIPAKLLSRFLYWQNGSGVKMNGWRYAARRVLSQVLAEQPDACVYSRALPFESIACAGTLRQRRKFRWIVNINDPMPGSLWPGLYQLDPHSDRCVYAQCRRYLPLADAFTFPSTNLRDIELAAFPFMQAKPLRVLPHVAISHVPSTPLPDTLTAEGRLRIGFAGTLRKTRICHELKTALDALVSESPTLAQTLELQFHLARPNPHAAAFITSLPVVTKITLGQFDAALDRLLLECHVILDMESPQDKPLLLTKLANASALPRPLWSICAPGGTAWSLVHEHGWGYASEVGNTQSIRTTLQHLVTDWQKGKLKDRAPTSALVELFSSKRVVSDLIALCQQ